MKPRKNSYPPVNVGSSFMLVILIILCMVVFAVLSLSGALRDARYTRKTTERNTAYYKANNTAEEKLKLIDQTLIDISKETKLFTKEYQTAALSAFGHIEGISAFPDETKENAIIIQYAVPIGEDEELSVTLTANNQNTDTDGYYSISEWKQGTTKEWNGDSSLPLLK